VDWLLDPRITYLNHGSFGACPRSVLTAQAEWRERIERDPVRFLDHELEAHLDGARAALAEFVGAQPQDIVFVPNATTGVNAVLRSLELKPGDELLTTDHEYNACLNAMHVVAERAGARVIVARVPFPVASPAEATDAILEAASPRTRLAVVSHITSPTALLLPIERVVHSLAERGIDTLVDGAHAPGMVALDMDGLGAAYYAGNCHKWLCAPRGSGFLHVRGDRQAGVRPVVVSHGANSYRRDRSRFLLDFDWTGTADPSAYLSVPTAIEVMGALMPGGWAALMAVNRDLALSGRRKLLAELGGQPAAPPEMLGSMATLILPDGLEPPAPEMPADAPPGSAYPPDPLHSRLLERHAIQVPVSVWPQTVQGYRPRLRLLRVSAQAYNSESDFTRLAAALRKLRAH
jgi:isopenicillin-N epimerase